MKIKTISKNVVEINNLHINKNTLWALEYIQSDNNAGFREKKQHIEKISHFILGVMSNQGLDKNHQEEKNMLIALYDILEILGHLQRPAL